MVSRRKGAGSSRGLWREEGCDQSPVALVAVNDGLHGDLGHTLVPGECVSAASAMEEAAAASGWRIAASEAMAKAVDQQATFGRRATTERGDPAVEITGLASA